MVSSREFDERSAAFTRALNVAAGWKHNFMGAAYSTRLEAALRMAEQACRDLEQLLIDDGALTTARHLR